MSLLRWTGVVGEMLPDEPNGRNGGDERHDTADEPADIVSFKVDLTILKERFRIFGLIRDDRTCHVDHDGPLDEEAAADWCFSKTERRRVSASEVDSASRH